MAWWGKVVGGAFGFLLGGPLGAMLGAVLGHSVDSGLERLGGFAAGEQERIQAAFFAATFSVMGHVCKADGRVSEREIAMARRVMSSMQLNAAQSRAAIELFNQGKLADFPLDEALEQFRRECRGRITLMLVFVELQVQAAFADGRFDARERRVVEHIAERLHVGAEELERIIGMIHGAEHSRATGAGRLALADAYEILGVDQNTDDDDVKRAYRRLMNRHHPDKLVAKGLPEEMIEVATEKTQQIRAAYERIREARAA